MPELKERERKILNYMKKIIQTQGYPPTVREICDALSIKSTSTVHKDLETLVRAGFLKKDPSKPRALVVVDKDDNASQFSAPSSEVVELPLVGRVAAGMPITAVENIEDKINMPASFVGHGKNFMLRVKGDSMIEAGIMDGDLIIVEQTPVANNGDIVVALVDGFEQEATVKKFYKRDGYVELKPCNSSMSPIKVNDVRIAGKVKGVFRMIN